MVTSESARARVVIRLDDRLIHGQVVADWLRWLAPCDIMVVSLSNPPPDAALLRVVTPQQYDLAVLTPEAARPLLSTQVVPHNRLVVTDSVSALVELLPSGWSGEVILGALAWRVGREYVFERVYLDADEAEVLQSLADSGVRLIYRARYHDSGLLWRRR
ncbi:MAG: PTS sugar transporter subunit IIB [Chloroflexi bacterium]|nr:PTS sugar transporter subunit IIB [Chloroflexota bacterium]